MNDASNNGLDIPIYAFAPMVAKHENRALNISRADLWALAAMVAADVAPKPPLSHPVSFAMTGTGRINCEDLYQQCLDSHNQVVPCSATRGPFREMPSPNYNTAEVLNFFSDQFGFDANETTCIMGAHNMGTLVRTVSNSNAVACLVDQSLSNTILNYWQPLLLFKCLCFKRILVLTGLMAGIVRSRV